MVYQHIYNLSEYTIKSTKFIPDSLTYWGRTSSADQNQNSSGSSFKNPPISIFQDLSTTVANSLKSTPESMRKVAPCACKESSVRERERPREAKLILGKIWAIALIEI